MGPLIGQADAVLYIKKNSGLKSLDTVSLNLEKMININIIVFMILVR